MRICNIFKNDFCTKIYFANDDGDVVKVLTFCKARDLTKTI